MASILIPMKTEILDADRVTILINKHPIIGIYDIRRVNNKLTIVLFRDTYNKIAHELTKPFTFQIQYNDKTLTTCIYIDCVVTKTIEQTTMNSSDPLVTTICFTADSIINTVFR